MNDYEDEYEQLRDYLNYFESEDVTECWPGLTGHYRPTSPPDPEYNSLAWAIHSNGIYFEPVDGYTWHPGLSRELTVASYRRFLGVHRYVVEAADDQPVEGWEKVAIYASTSGEPRHVARQLESGKWTSKLADGIDIEHDNLECLEGEHFGSVNCILQRERTQQS